jgi:flavin-dependent dehydrogenase
MAERADLIVVGAGPAGSATAYYAARAGLKVLLLDRQGFPRDKPCGDGLMPHAAEEISLMGLGDWLDKPRHGKFSAFSVYTQTALLRQKVPPTLHGPYGYVVPRKETQQVTSPESRPTRTVMPCAPKPPWSSPPTGSGASPRRG